MNTMRKKLHWKRAESAYRENKTYADIFPISSFSVTSNGVGISAALDIGIETVDVAFCFHPRR